MYKITVEGKSGYAEIELYYECQQDAFNIIRDIQNGDLDNQYTFVFEIVEKEAE